MSNPDYIQEAHADNFKSLVLENSERGPVMVCFWSPRAGPCMKLMPRLIRLADEYCGKFMLVLLDTDQFGRLAKDEYGVASVPTVKFFRHGKVAHTIHGPESDSEFRRGIDKFVPREASMAQVNASRAYHQEGDVEQACALLAKALLADPDNTRLALDLSKLLIIKKDYARAEAVLQALSPVAQEDSEIGTLLVHAGFLRVAQSAPEMATLLQDIAAEPGKSVARYQLSALLLLQDDFAGAMDQLLEIVQRDRAFRDDAGRKGLLAIFNMLGNESELVSRYRALLVEALA